MSAVISRSDRAGAPNGDAKPARPVRAVHTLQRSSGSVDLLFAENGGVSRATRTFQSGAARVRFPNVPSGRPPEGVLINIAGGMAGGDRQDIAVSLEPRAAATITTQACERIYRSLGDEAIITGRMDLAAGARMEWLPQPVIFFDGARLKRETQVSLAPDAILLAVESVIFGRFASGEEVEYGALSDAWFVRRGGRLVHAERFNAGGAVRQAFARPMVLDGNRAMATVRYIAPDAHARLDEMRSLLAESAIPAAASAWNGLMLVRFVAPDGYCLNRELVRVLAAFRNGPLPRAWML